MTFLDSNVLIYFIDGRDAAKQARARKILSSAIASPEYRISNQVLNEFANVALKKLHLTDDEVIEYVDAFRSLRIVMPEVGWTHRALEFKRMFKIQFYDALMLTAAESCGCDTILTEDLNDGQLYCGIKAVNPFKSK